MPYFQDAVSNAGQAPGRARAATDPREGGRPGRIEMTEELEAAVGWRAFFREHAAGAEELERPAYRWTEKF